VTGSIGDYFTANTSNWYWQPAAVQVSAATGVSLSGITVRRMAAAGISFLDGAQNCTVEGAIVNDLSGAGIIIGDVTYAASAPSDARTIVSGITVRRSIVTGAGLRWLDSDCIGEGYAYGSTFDHNDVGVAIASLPSSGCGYSGIHSGFGWGAQNCASGVCGNTTITGNFINGACVGPTNGGCDGGQIYLNGFRNGTTTISGNYVSSGIGTYNDNGTNGVSAVGNVYNNGGGYYVRFNSSPIAVTGNSWNNGYADALALTLGTNASNTVSGNTIAGPPFAAAALLIIDASGY
jgi:hypothetical protein